MYSVSPQSLYISDIYNINMRKIPLISANEIKVNNIVGYLEKKVTKFGTGAKIDIPKEYLDKKVIILVCKD